MKPGLGARVCQRCGNRVDERRGKFSPYCLSCGQPLDDQRISTAAPYSSAIPAARPSVGRQWMIALACVLSIPLLSLALFLAFKASPQAEPAAPATSGVPPLPSVEAPATASGGGSGSPGRIPRPPGSGPSPRPTPTPHSSGGDDPPPFVPHAFPRALANERLDEAMNTIASCRRDGDPTGSSAVDVTFEGDGRVETTLRPPFASTPTGDCISARLLGLRNSVGRFVGGPFTLRRAFAISP